MDRTRESRRSSMTMASSTNGFPTRRPRSVPLRDSSEEGAVVQVREASSKKGRNREKDRDSSSRSKRRRGSHSHREEGEPSTEDSVGNEQDDDVRDAGISRIRSSSSASDKSHHRRNFTAAKPPPPRPPFKVVDEVIGVVVPRKARSASLKRLHESWVSGGTGGGENRTFRQRSNSPGRRIVEPAWPSSSNASVRKKMKAIEAEPETLKLASSDIEIEIAELLTGLRSSKGHEFSSQKLEASMDHHASESCHSKDIAEKNKLEEFKDPKYSCEDLLRIQGQEQPADVDCHENGSSAVPKEDIGEDKVNPGAGFGGAYVGTGRFDAPTNESQSCSKLDADKQDSASTRMMCDVPDANTKRVGKFEIDLMATPPMMLSLEGDDLSKSQLTSETKALAPDVEMKRIDSIEVEDKAERPVNQEKTPEEIEEANMIEFKKKLNVLKHDLVTPNNDNDIMTNNKLEKQDRNKEQPSISSNPKVQKIDHSSSVPLPAGVSGRPSNLTSIGCKPLLQKVGETDKTKGGSSKSPQGVNSVLSQPKRKRCATHYYIARNILHQQYTKMSPPLPAAIGPGSLCGIKPNNVDCVPSSSKQSQKHFPGVNQKGAQEKVLVATSDPSLAAFRSSNNANPMDSTHMQLVLQQGPYPGSIGTLVGPAFVFGPGQHQASVAAPTNQAGGVNFPSSASSYNRSHSSVAGSLDTSSTLPAAAAAMSCSYPKFSANDSPYVTIVSNNGYSFPYSTAVIRGVSPGGPFYSSQILHPLQYPQQHPHSKVLVQPSYPNASISSISSSHKQSQGAQGNGNNIMTSKTREQPSQKQRTPQSHPRKHEVVVGGENVPSVANRTSYAQKNVHGQNFTIPVQPMNLSFKPSATSDKAGGNSGIFADKQQKQQASKGGVEIVPSQAFAVSFATFNGTSVPSSLNFSSLAQNPQILHSLPDIAYQGYPAASTPYTTQQKTCSITGDKSGGNSSQQDDVKKITHGKSPTIGPTTLVFDNSSKNQNFVMSSTSGNWPSGAIASTAIINMPFSGNASGSQQQPQSLQLQNMQQPRPAMSTRKKALSATKFAMDTPVLSQSLAQCKSSNQNSLSKTLGRTTASHVHHKSIITSSAPTVKSLPQEKGRDSKGHKQISFGGNYTTSLPTQGAKATTTQ